MSGLLGLWLLWSAPACWLTCLPAGGAFDPLTKALCLACSSTPAKNAAFHLWPQSQTSAPAPSGGIFAPLAKALCLACGSDPAKNDGSEKKMGAYVMTTCFQTSTISSAMFITAMAANPLVRPAASGAHRTPLHTAEQQLERSEQKPECVYQGPEATRCLAQGQAD